MLRTSAVLYEICYQIFRIDKRRAAVMQIPDRVLGVNVVHAAPDAGGSEWR